MSDDPPFIDSGDATLDTAQIRRDTYPLTGLVALLGVLALAPFVLSLFAGEPPLVVIFTILAQFVLAVGADIVLIYVVARGIRLADA